jgi:hypothetical protein
MAGRNAVTERLVVEVGELEPLYLLDDKTDKLLEFPLAVEAIKPLVNPTLAVCKTPSNLSIKICKLDPAFLIKGVDNLISFQPTMFALIEPLKTNVYPVEAYVPLENVETVDEMFFIQILKLLIVEGLPIWEILKETILMAFELDVKFEFPISLFK